MILSAQSIIRRQIISPLAERTTEDGYSYGLSPAGYDLRLDLGKAHRKAGCCGDADEYFLYPGEFILAATFEHFNMPNDVVGRVCDKSSLARRGVSVFNTVIEPGWRGYLTLEIVNKGADKVRLVQGQGVAQVLFELLDAPTIMPYSGKYQNQEAGPQPARV